ncbi:MULTISPECIES: DUF2851 family protein [Flavobacteriaceae]|uniref:DUF2851 family protein n=2 Tax=Flavobacteriaceae TaxID=49546 RepID=A0A4Y8ANF8_9FLAO|nr:MULTISPECIES: DUF2851 family protein [Flavobacteriaceae]TEW71863.1 DUF2851 family protein [Gramella jeungdoensis]GGK59893.1 hypothetical protein GCM10007963_30060 [Lutibacter litoralis]
MNENLLHFLWKLKLFSVKKLKSTNGEIIHIISNGIHNLNTGPDFLNAKIEIENQVWAGNVEIHINSSDWYKHNHEADKNYDAVILHVVWEHDVEIFRNNNAKIVTLELKNYISKAVLNSYNQLFSKNKKWINCENDIQFIDSFIFENWLERLYFERLEQKSSSIQEILTTNNNNWEATLFMLLAKSFGLKVNGDAFLNFANSFDFSIVRKVSNNVEQLEALFLGQAGLLSNKYESIYFEKLNREYEYLKVKFKLTPILGGQVQFFRLRPNNFPTIRLSQLAFLYSKYQNLFSKIIEIDSLELFYSLFEVSTFPFWETHFTFDKESKKSTKKLTKSFIDLILINTIIPLKFVYLKNLGKNEYSSLFAILENIKPEKNSIISRYNDLNIESPNAFKTQALLQLKNEYCSKQLCLQCAIGKTILKKS